MLSSAAAYYENLLEILLNIRFFGYYILCFFNFFAVFFGEFPRYGKIYRSRGYFTVKLAWMIVPGKMKIVVIEYFFLYRPVVNISRRNKTDGQGTEFVYPVSSDVPFG